MLLADILEQISMKKGPGQRLKNMALSICIVRACIRGLEPFSQRVYVACRYIVYT